ncbi:MAG: stage VI sporulation protein F [Bacilli bacterium]|nr:stage VI sporulation protein F [Bacilli bacterium]
MAFNDGFFKKVEKKTKVDKNTILNLAQKLQNGNMKDEKTLKEIIQTLSKMTGKKVSAEQEEKIISKIVNDEVPKGVDKMF